MSLIFASFALSGLAVLMMYFLWRRSSVVVYPHQTILRMAWGRLQEEINQPGWYFRPILLVPGNKYIKVSRQLDFQNFRDVHVNDLDGTTLRIDLWLEYRVVDAKKNVFAVESWRESLRHLVVHTLMTQAGSTRLDALLTERDSFAQAILQEVRKTAQHWGLEVTAANIQDIRLLPEISRQLFGRVAAQLEMKKAKLEEEGRIAIQTLQAKTQLRVSELHAKAKTMHPLAVGRAYDRMAKNPQVLESYQELHHLSLLQPGRLVSFVGFSAGEVRPLDAMMIPDVAGDNKIISEGMAERVNWEGYAMPSLTASAENHSNHS